MDRAILHVDCNKFYASVECCRRPALRELPLAVGGDEAMRHGIVLTKNELAARCGISTGEPLWSARQKCPGLVVVPPDFPTYIRYSGMVRQILDSYTDRVEPFGLDEAWLELTGCPGSPEATADEIRQRVHRELGITVSIGVSFNKTFAKLGSDYKKPDAVTVFSRENFREKVWPLPAGSLLFVGRATQQKLAQRYIFTIGDIARAEPALLRSLLGKCGSMLHAAANGLDGQPVIPAGQEAAIQSVSNSMTTYRDLLDDHDAHLVLTALAETVGRRLRGQHLCGRTVEVHARDNTLSTHAFRTTLDHYICSTEDIAGEAIALLQAKYRWAKPLRTLTVGISGLAPDTTPSQTDLLGGAQRERRERLDVATDALRRRFGEGCVRRAILLEDPALAGLRPPR